MTSLDLSIRIPEIVAAGEPERAPATARVLGRSRADLAAIALLTAAWVGMVLAAGPRGEFPMNDDWSYALAVKALVEEGRYRLTDWTSMPLLTQVLWGAAFCLPKGFSFEALRLSSLVLGWVGVVATYRLLRLACDRPFATLGAAAVAANPIFFTSAHTFMTDVPFYGFGLLGSWLLLDGTRRGRRGWVAAGVAALVAATLLRQLGVVFAAAYAVAHVYQYGWRPRALARAALPVVVCLAAFVGYNALLAHFHGVPGMYNRQNASVLAAVRSPVATAGRGAYTALRAALYLGLFAVPLIVAFPRRAGGPAGRRARAVGLAAAAACLASVPVIAASGRAMPLLGNIWFGSGLGPVLTRDGPLSKSGHWPVLPPAAGLALLCLSAAGAAVLAHRLIDAIATAWLRRPVRGTSPGQSSPDKTDGPDARMSAIFALAFVAGYVGLISLLGAAVFDRYLIVPLPFVLLAFGTIVAPAAARRPAGPRGADRPNVPAAGDRSWRPAATVAAGVIVLAAVGLFAVAGTRDLMAFNRARWSALNELTAAGVPAADIDGGFEFNGLHRYADYRLPAGAAEAPLRTDPCPYVVALAPLPGYEVAARHPFPARLPPRVGEVVVLRRAGPPPAPTAPATDTGSARLAND